MLVLTRKVEQGIMIGDDVKIRVLEIKGHQIKLGIDAPREVGVYREEIWVRIQKEQAREQNRDSVGVLAKVRGCFKFLGQRAAL